MTEVYRLQTCPGGKGEVSSSSPQPEEIDASMSAVANSWVGLPRLSQEVDRDRNVKATKEQGRGSSSTQAQTVN